MNRLTFEKVENRYPFGDNEVIEKNPHHFEIFNSRKEKIGNFTGQLKLERWSA